MNLFLLSVKKIKPRGHATFLKIGAVVFKKFRYVNLEINGFKIILDLRFDCDIEMFINESLPHEKGLEIILKKIVVRDDIFFDIGANLGYYSFLLAGSLKKIFMFEPNIMLYENIRKAMLSKDGQVNLEVFNIALGEFDTYLKLNVSDSQHNLGNFRNQKNSEGYTVQCLNGDRFIRDNSINFPSILKIDVEGFELNVLKGLMNTVYSQKPIIFMEWTDVFASEVGYCFNDLESFFDQSEWMIFRIENDGSLRKSDICKPKSSNDLLIVHIENLRLPDILTLITD